MTDSVLIRLHGFHALHGYHSATVRLVDENGSAVLEGKCTGTGHEGFQLFADSNGDFPACEYVLSVSYDLLVELTVDDKPTVAALVSAPHTSTVIHRKIVPRLVNTDHGAVAITFVVSPKDQDGYRTRLTTLLQMVDPSSVDSVPDVMASMSEPAAFSFAWREYGTTDLPFEDRARTLARRYAIDVTEFLEKVEAAEPETLLTLFVEQLLLHHAVLESQDQMPAQRVIGLIRKYGLNEEEVTAALDEAEDREEFIEELRDAFGPEPRLNDPVHAVITNRIAPHSAVPAVATPSLRLRRATSKRHTARRNTSISHPRLHRTTTTLPMPNMASTNQGRRRTGTTRGRLQAVTQATSTSMAMATARMYTATTKVQTARRRHCIRKVTMRQPRAKATNLIPQSSRQTLLNLKEKLLLPQGTTPPLTSSRNQRSMSRYERPVTAALATFARS
jgi:hypothetical protein